MPSRRPPLQPAWLPLLVLLHAGSLAAPRCAQARTGESGDAPPTPLQVQRGTGDAAAGGPWSVPAWVIWTTAGAITALGVSGLLRGLRKEERP